MRAIKINAAQTRNKTEETVDYVSALPFEMLVVRQPFSHSISFCQLISRKCSLNSRFAI